MQIMPQVTDPNAFNGKAFGQLRTDRFNPFTPILANFAQLNRVGFDHIFTSRGDDGHALTFL